MPSHLPKRLLRVSVREKLKNLRAQLQSGETSLNSHSVAAVVASRSAVFCVKHARRVSYPVVQEQQRFHGKGMSSRQIMGAMLELLLPPRLPTTNLKPCA